MAWPVVGGNASTSSLLGLNIRVVTDGDSKGDEPRMALRWLKSFSPFFADLENGAQLNVGGSNTSNAATYGLTNSARIAAMTAAVAANTAAGYVTDLYLTIGTNDATANTSPETIVTNVGIYYDAFVAAGGRNLILMSIDPRTLGNAAGSIATNRAYEDFCLFRKNAFFCDTTPYWLDPAITTDFAPIGGSAGLAGAYTRDGLHASGLGMYNKRLALNNIVNALYVKRTLKPISKMDVWGLTTAQRGNMLGANGRFTAMGGTNSITGGTVTGTPPLGWTVAGALDVGVACTFSVGASSLLNTYTGLTGNNCVNVALTGTATTAGSLTFSSANAIINSPGAGRYTTDTLLGANALAGIDNFQTYTYFSQSGSVMLGSPTGILAAYDKLPAITGLIDMETSLTDTSNPFAAGLVLVIKWQAGAVFGGSLDLIGSMIRRSPTV